MQAFCGLSVMLILTMTVFAPGTEARADDDAIAQQAAQLYRLSGSEKQTQSMEPQVLAGLSEAAGALPKREYALLVKVVREHFSADVMRRRALAIIEAEWNADAARDALRWLRSDLGQSITAREEHAATPEGIDATRQYARTLSAEPPGTERVALVRRLSETYGGTEFAVDVALATGLAVIVGVNGVSAEHEQLDLDQMRRFIEKDRETLFGQMEQVLLITNLYTYSELSDEQLREYIGFLESESGVWYMDTMIDATVQPMTALSMELGAVLKQALQDKGRALDL